jgi:gliding motility-associated-like protein
LTPEPDPIIYQTNRLIRQSLILSIATILVMAPCSGIFAQEIPVVVHIVSQDPDKITDLMVEAGIKDLNEAFAHSGTYAGQGPGYNTGLKFCLARKDPNGGNTRGITRTKSVLGAFDRDIEDARMKGLVSWDTRRYCNIWFVDSLKTELFPTYVCGQWERTTEQGYATFPGYGEFTDGVVVNTFGRVLAHNMGHYLGLAHTFIINECANNDCNVDGDGICDTPPSRVNTNDCPSVNSCSSDTVNAQGPDLPDLVANFMTYNNCTNSFTKGQADKMKAVLSSTRSSLLWPGRCDPACPAENVLAEFTRDNWFPVPNDVVKFTNTNSVGSTYEWYIDGVQVANGKSMSHAFPAIGKYAVTLKVYNASPSCFGSQTDSVIVTCGVMSRYFPDKRIIASKDPILLDEVIFTNRSVPANASFEWWLGNGGTFPNQMVSSQKDLKYTFLDSGKYVIRLVAKVGACTDTTFPYMLIVEDPTIDLNISGTAVCVDDTKVEFKAQVCNNGYATMPSGVPVTFYDDDPTKTAAKKLGQYLLPFQLTGKCCQSMSYTFDVGRRGLDRIFAVVNDDGSLAAPFKLLEQPPSIPNSNSKIPEKLYANNMSAYTGFAFKVSVSPASASPIPGQDVPLNGSVSLKYKDASWLPSPRLSCQNCLAPVYKTGFEDDKLYFRASSPENCHDTAVVNITVPPWNDFKVTINGVECQSAGNVLVDFTVCNDFVNGYIPAGLVVSFYRDDPSKPGSPALVGTKFLTQAVLNTKCGTFTHLLPANVSGTLFAVVNDIGTAPFSIPATKEFQERDYANNIGQSNYDTRSSIIVVPTDTTVLRGQQVQVRITSPVAKPSSIRWTPDPSLLVSCTAACTDPVVTVLGNGLLRLQMENRLSCRLDTFVSLKILPPDFKVTVDSAQCYNGKETIVDFTVCTGNGYDTIPAALPVAFFEGIPNSGNPALLPSLFQTSTAVGRTCVTYTHVVPTPLSGRFFAVVNQRPTVVIPTSAFPESDLTNNSSAFTTVPFTVSIIPQDTTVPRLSRLPLGTSRTGGIVTAYNWTPSSILTCTDCPNPVANIPYTSTVSLEARNRFSCLATDTVIIKTYAEGRYQIPTAFTPNGDGLNDVFYLIGNRDLALVRDFSIYDRYGQRVFQRTNGRPNDPAYGWNGRRSGTPVTIGTYAYTFVVELVDGTVESLKGLITVVR